MYFFSVQNKKMNFDGFHSINRFLPKQSSLTIYNTSQLYINLEGCVNTLRGECLQFLHTHGRDGDNNTAQSRYLCYYNKVSFNFYFSTFYNCIWDFNLSIHHKYFPYMFNCSYISLNFTSVAYLIYF